MLKGSLSSNRAQNFGSLTERADRCHHHCGHGHQNYNRKFCHSTVWSSGKSHGQWLVCVAHRARVCACRGFGFHFRSVTGMPGTDQCHVYRSLQTRCHPIRMDPAFRGNNRFSTEQYGSGQLFVLIQWRTNRGVCNWRSLRNRACLMAYHLSGDHQCGHRPGLRMPRQYRGGLFVQSSQCKFLSMVLTFRSDHRPGCRDQ